MVSVPTLLGLLDGKAQNMSLSPGGRVYSFLGCTKLQLAGRREGRTCSLFCGSCCDRFADVRNVKFVHIVPAPL